MEKRFQSFNEALKYYETDARSFDLKEKQPKVWRIYIERKSIIENADFMEEVQEVFEASKKAVQDLKKNLLLDYNNANKLHINDGRLTGYFLYKDLYQLADDKLKQIESPKTQPIETKKEIETESLKTLITHQKSESIVSSIKVRYKNIMGKRLKLLLLALQDLNLIPKERIGSKFHRCCKREFGWDVASYNAMNGYAYNENTDSTELNEMKEYIESIIQ